MRTLTYYVGMTVDGMIAGPDGEIDFFPLGQDLVDWFVTEYPEVLPSHLRGPLGVTAGPRHFDTVVQGRATYEVALTAGITSPYAHLRQYVVSSSLGASPDPAVTVIDGDPLAAVRALKAEDGAGIYLAGGGRLAGELLPEIDELVIKVYPTVAGAGIPLFTAGFAPTQLTLVGTRSFDSGAVVLHYRRG
jgi:dihydrofolate reductase